MADAGGHQDMNEFMSIVNQCAQHVDDMEDGVDFLNYLLRHSDLAEVGRNYDEIEVAVEQLSHEYGATVPAMKRFLKLAAVALGLDSESRIYVVYTRLVDIHTQDVVIDPSFVTRSRQRANAFIAHALQRDADNPGGGWVLEDIWYIRAQNNVVYPDGMHVLPRQVILEVDGDPVAAMHHGAQEDQTFIAALSLEREGEMGGTVVVYKIGNGGSVDAQHNVIGHYDRDYNEHEGLINEDQQN